MEKEGKEMEEKRSEGIIRKRKGKKEEKGRERKKKNEGKGRDSTQLPSSP